MSHLPKKCDDPESCGFSEDRHVDSDPFPLRSVPGK